MLLSRRVIVGAFLSCALAVTCASPALATELTEGGAAGEETGSVEQVYQGFPSDETDPLADASPATESPTGPEGASDQVISAATPKTSGEDSSEDGPYLSDPSSLETSYEELKLFAEKNYSDMPNPQRGTEQTGFRRRSSPPFWEGPSFFFGDGTLYLSPALKVVDVSEWQGVVDWEKVKASGVDAAIIRAGYASGNEDKYLRRNISECERLGIPYGLYLYSYAYDADYAKKEAVWTASLINRYGAHPDLPIFYDLEEWTWTGHTPPTKVSEYEKIVDAYLATMKSYGYTDVSVYSYTSYLLGPLNSPSIWAKTSWVAQYNSSLTFTNPFEPAFHGWQYTSSASVPGISGKADLSAFTPRGSVSAAGWRTIGGRTYYFDESGNMVRGWLDLDGKRYRLDKDYGYLWTGWYEADGHVYYAREDGSIVYGWLDLDGKRYRLDKDCGYLWTGWYTVDGTWYHADSSGVVSRGGWTQIDGKTYYLDPATGARHQGWLDLDGKRYRLDKDQGFLWTGKYEADGGLYYARNDGSVIFGWIELSGKKYYVGQNGVVYGWLDLDGGRYRLDKDYGYLWTGWYTVDGTWYHADSSGVVSRGGWTQIDGKTYYLDPATGARHQGWLDLDGKRYRLDKDQGFLWTGWYEADGSVYYAGQDGAVTDARGWTQIDGKTYYLDPATGARHQGWLDLDGRRYRLDKDYGYLWTGWYEADGRVYYAREDGSIVYGWLDLDGRRYRLDKDYGYLWTGWYEADGRVYYGRSDGSIVYGWLDLDGRRYRLDKDYGYLWTGWYEADGRVYYGRSDGSIVYGWLDLDGRRYRLDKDYGYLWTGWYEADGRVYYGRSDGSIVYGWLDLDGKRYRLDINNGFLWTGWFSVGDGYWYYGGPDGAIYTGTHVIDGIQYTFDEYGRTTVTPVQAQMASKAQHYASNTSYLVMVDTTNNYLGVFTGGYGNWSLLKFWRCSTGASATPTVLGQFTVGAKGYSFGSGYTCYYYTQFFGDYLIHSIKYYQNTFSVLDGRLGMNISHGCVRLPLDEAWWIYSTIPTGTKVVTYR